MHTHTHTHTLTDTQTHTLSLTHTHSHTHTHTHTRYSSSSFIVTFSLIRRTACAHAQFSGCSSTNNAHSETGQMAVCCQILTLGALSRCSALSMVVGPLFKKFGLFLNTPRTLLLNFMYFMYSFIKDLSSGMFHDVGW